MAFLMDILSEPYAGSRRKEAEFSAYRPVGADIAPLVARAQERCVLNAELAAFLARLAWDGKTIPKIITDLRLPHPSWWVEWDERLREQVIDRVEGMEKPTNPIPVRVGIYFEAREGSDGRVGTAVVCWRHSFAKWAEVSQLALAFDFRRIPEFPNAPSKVETVPASVYQHFRVITNPHGPSKFGVPWFFTEQGGVIQDVATEIGFIPALLALPLLHDEVRTTSYAPPRDVNRVRVRKGLPPILSHTRLALKRDAGEPRGLVGERASPCAHFVRGHFKRTQSGPRWWRPHRRGKGEPVSGAMM